MYGRYDKCIGLGSGIYVNVREKKKPKEQSRMNNPETQAPLDTIGMTKTNTNKNIAQRIKKISNRVTNIYS
jgi:hypothetical protein